MTLIVPDLGDWCALALPEQQSVRVVSSRHPPTGHPRDHTLPAAQLPAARLPAALPDRRRIDAPEALVAFGADPESAAALVDVGPLDCVSAPLRAYGTELGSLTVARALASGGIGPTEQAVIERVARHASLAIASARFYEERTTLARTLRAALLPPPLPAVPGIELGARYRAAQEATEIGGDFYQVYASAEDGWIFEIGDVCGKGVDAAVLTGQVRQSLRTVTLIEPDPSRTLEVLNRAMLSIDGSKFVTVVHGRLEVDPAGGANLRLAGGGHPRPLLLRRDGAVETVQVSGMIVGMLREATFRTTAVRLEPGETLLLYTDGVTEARVDGRQLGVRRLAASLADCGGMPAQSIVERLEQLVLDYLQGRPHDDIALLAIRAAERDAA